MMTHLIIVTKCDVLMRACELCLRLARLSVEVSGEFRSGDGHPHPATLSSASLHGAHPRNNEGETQYCARVGDGTELEECFNNFWRKLVRRFLAHLQPRVRDGAAFLALYISIL